MAAEQGNCMPRASCIEFIVVAVALMLQKPVEGAEEGMDYMSERFRASGREVYLPEAE